MTSLKELLLEVVFIVGPQPQSFLLLSSPLHVVLVTFINCIVLHLISLPFGVVPSLGCRAFVLVFYSCHLLVSSEEAYWGKVYCRRLPKVKFLRTIQNEVLSGIIFIDNVSRLPECNLMVDTVLRTEFI